MPTTNRNRTTLPAADEKMIDGFTKNAKTLDSLFIHGARMSVADLVALLQKRVDSNGSVLLTKAAWHQAVRSDQDVRAQTGAVVTSMRQALQLAFADSPQILADYGVTPRKTGVRTPQQKVASAAKARATRTARHTMGPKQKAQIKGTVEVPVTSLAHPAVGATTPMTPAPAATAPAPPPNAQVGSKPAT